MLIEMNVEGIILDERTGTYVLVLKDRVGSQTLPIWIGQPEAESIAIAIEKMEIPRPLTHDFLRNTLSALNIRISKVVITDLRDNTYYADVHLEDSSGETRVDARPSDAIASALRFNAPIYVNDDLLESRQKDELQDWLQNIKPKDFEDNS
jgi:bifunctional DNase/RNase